MSDLTTTQKSGTWPLANTNERKNILAPVLATPENSDREGPLGFFDPKELKEYKVEIFGMSGIGSISFDTDKVVQPSIVSEMFGENDKWILIKPSNVAEKAVNTASTAIKAAGNLAAEAADAGLDIFNKMTGLNQETKKTEVSQDSSNLDPSVAEKQEEAKEYSVIKEAEEVIAKEQADYRGKELFEKAVMSKKAEIAELANLQGNYRDVLDDNGDVRTDLETSVAQARKKIMEDQQAKQEPLVSTAKVGGQGVNTDQDRINEGSSILSTTGGGGAG